MSENENKTAQPEPAVNVKEYKCPCCGAGLKFDGAAQKMGCEYCGNSFDMETVRQYNDSLQSEAGEQFQWEEYDADSGNGDWKEGEQESLQGYICPSCGGEIVGDATTAATRCPYCDNPAVLPNQVSGMYRPDYVIPFRKSREEAKQAFRDNCKGKRLLPKFFLDEQRMESIMGIYVPFWLFDCDTDANISYNATKVRHWSDSNYRYTKTDYFLVNRSGSMGFEKVPVDGSKKMDDTYMEAIEPFQYKDMVDFDTAYLSGYLADKYDVDAEQNKPRANQRIRSSVESLMRSTVKGYSSVTVKNSHIRFADGKVSYALLPVWVLNTRYKDKLYMFAMNGQTGKFVGELPISWKKFWMYFGGLFALFFVIGCIFVWFILL